MINSTIPQFFDELAPHRDYWIAKNSFYYGEMLRLHRWLVEKNRSVLEIGCGTGQLLAGLDPTDGEGIDASFEMIKIAQAQHPHYTFRVMDAHHLEFQRTFDYVILSNLVGYVDDIWQVFRQLRQVCHRDTRIIITSYNYLWQPLLALAQLGGQKMPDRIQNWLPQQFIDHFLYLNGFEVVQKGNYFHCPKAAPGARMANDLLAQVPLVSRLGMITWCVARPTFFTEAALSDVSVSVIVPTHEESGNIETVVNTMPQIGTQTELLFVDLPGKDGTREKIDAVRKQYSGPVKIRTLVQKEKTGKIGALRQGVAQATGDIILIYDADGTVPAADLEKFYRALIEGKAEFVNGTRLVYPTEKGALRFFNHVANWVFAVLFTWGLGQHFTDTLCGSKGFWKHHFRRFEKEKTSYDGLDRYGDFYLLLSSYRHHLKIAEVPVRYTTRRYGDTKIQRFTNGWEFFRQFVFFLWEYKIRRRK